MHEFSVAVSLVESASTEARRAGAVRVTGLLCRIGRLTHIDASVLSEAFGLAAENSMCAGAELRVETADLEAACPRCGKRFPVRRWEWRCPDCGSEGTDATGGDEIVLVSLEAEVPDEDPSA